MQLIMGDGIGGWTGILSCEVVGWEGQCPHSVQWLDLIGLVNFLLCQ